jgi:hypothetical protein
MKSTPIPRLVEALGGGHSDSRCPTDSSLSPKETAAWRAYEVTLLWLPPRPEDPISDIISGLPSEPATAHRGSLETLESFDPRAPIPQANPAQANIEHR